MENIKWLLALALAAANYFVWRGVYLEKDEFPDSVKEHGWRMLVTALACEVVLAVLMIAVDFELSRQQSQTIAELHQQAAKFGNDAATARLEAQRLKQLVTWREVTPSVADKLKASLTAKSGSVNIFYTQGDPESQMFAEQLSRPIKESGWTVYLLAYESSPIVRFVTIPDDAEESTKTLQNAFEQSAIPFSKTEPTQNWLARSDGKQILTSFAQPIISGVSLFVGSKPQFSN